MKKRPHKPRRNAGTKLSKIRSHKGPLFLAATIIVVVVTVILFYARHSPKTYYVAYIGRDQNPRFDRLHELALERYIAELNEELHGVRLQLKRFTNRVGEDKYESQKLYDQISDDPGFVAVIDNTWGKELKRVAPTIRNNRIPVIATNADKQDQDYGHDVVFIGYDDDIPRKVVSFSKLVLGNDDVVFITEDDYPLTDKFVQEFKRPETKTEYSRLGVPDATVRDNDKAKLFAELDRELTKKKQPDKRPTIVMNTHGMWGVEIIKHIDAEEKDVNILGGPYIINWSKYREEYGDFGVNDRNNKLIVLTYPSDAVTNKVHNDLIKIKAANPDVAMEEEQFFVKRCLDAVAIIRAAFLVDKDTQKFRSDISRLILAEFFERHLVDKEITTQDDLYSFDKDLFLTDARGFEEHSHGEVLSYPTQLNGNATAFIPNIYFGLDSINISNVDLEHGSFHADFYYWIKFSIVHQDVENHIVFRNQNAERNERSLVSEEADKDRKYRLLKRSGDFNFAANVGKYPFDSQELRIEVDLIHSADALSISLDPDSLKRSKETKEFAVHGWDGKNIYITVDNLVATSLWGGSKVENKKPQKFRSVNIRIPVSRHWTSSFVTIILPLFMIGLAAVALLYVKDNSFGNIGEVCVVIFLSIVTYSIAFAQITPRSNLLTIADMLFYGTFLTVLLVFLKVIFFNSNMVNNRVRTWARDNATMIGHVVLSGYCLMILMIIVSGLT